MRSACRGEARNTSIPKRARSYRGPPVDIISIAQQANPNVAGHSEDLRVQLTSFSTLASRIPFGSFSSRPISVPIEAATPPHVGVGEADRCNKQGHLHQ